MPQYCKGTKEDAEDIVDFANYVFSKSSEPHDFKQLVPKLYADGQNTQPLHYLVKEDGKIKAMLCVLPVDFMVAGKHLKAGCVGTVSVHPYTRSKGYMKQLLTAAVADMKEQGFSYSVLGGQRQRYEYFGYTPAGMQLMFTLTSVNLRHKYGLEKADDITFTELDEKDRVSLDAAYALYCRRPVTGARSRETFCTIGKTWNATLYAVHKNGVFTGYISEQQGVFQEIELTDVSLLPAVCKAFFAACRLESVKIPLPVYDIEKVQLLSQVCEECTVCFDHNYHIMDYPAVMEAFMNVKAGYTSLADGHFVLEIQGVQTIEITVKDNTAFVNPTTRKADITLPPLQAAAFLFSPVSGYAFPTENKVACPAGWFPIPLYTPALDVC